MKKLSAFLVLALLLSSCTYAFNEGTREEAEDIPFISVQASINRNVGSVFLWGGVVVNSISAESGVYIEVAQSPLSTHGKIINPQFTHGRFIIYRPDSVASESLIDDKLIRGKTLSVAGVLIKGYASIVDGQAYTLPVIEARDIRPWDEVVRDVPASSIPSTLSVIFPWSIQKTP